MTSRPTVVCISSLQFETDMKVLQSGVREIDWHTLKDFALADAQVPFMPERMQQQTDYAYEQGPDIEEIWEKSRAVGLHFLDGLMKERRVTAVMAGNWDYWQDEAMRLACETRGIPFLTLLREHFLTAEDHEDGFGYKGYRLKPKTAGVAVAGELSRQTLSRFNIIPDERIRITGLPRFDLWYTPQPPLFERPVVLLSYLKGYGAPGQFHDMLKIFADVAERHPSIPFIVKSKHYGEHPALKKMVREISGKVQVALTSDMPRLLGGARAIIGYNSLSLYEGLFTDAPIFLPQWGEAKRPAKSQAPSPVDPLLKDHMTFFESEDDFKVALEKAIAGRIPVSSRADRIATFAKFVRYSPDEPASFRVRDFIREFGNT
jgi:hypothetical protein